MDELDLELEREKQRPVEVVKKGGWLGKIVALLLGIILGFVGCFGAIAAVVYYFIGVMKIEEGAGYLKGVLGDDFDYTDYIAGEYGDKTTLDLILSTTTAAQSVLDGTGTLNTLNDIYPFLYTVVAGAEDADPNAAFNGIVPMLKQYGLELDAALMMDLIVNGTGGEVLQPDKYLIDYILDNAYDLAIGDLLQIVPFPASPIIDALFYGEEGVDYVVNSDGLKEPLEGGTPWLTIEGLLFAEGDVIGERINAITLDTVLSVPESNDLMKALAYGASSHYEYVNGEAVMKQQTYTFDGTYFYDDNGEKVDGVITPMLHDMFYSITQDDKTLYLKVDENGNYLAYNDMNCTRAALYKKTTIGDLNGDTDSLINNIELGSTLKVTPSSNKVLLALAYGTEGEDYDVVNGEIKMRDGKKKRTIGDLTNGGDELIENIRLADVMETDTGDSIMMYLLYGKKDVHYELVDGEPMPISLQKQIAVLEHNDSKLPYNVYGDTRLDGTTDGATYTVDGITYYLSPVEDTTTTPATQMTVAIKDEDHTDVSGNAALYYVFEDEAKTIPVKFEPTSLGELMNDSSIISNLTNRLTLVEVMGETALQGTPMENLGQYVINDVPNQIETLQLKDIFDETELQNNKILKNLSESTLESLTDDVEKLTFSDIYDETDVAGNNVLEYLYTATDDEGNLYPITNLTEAVDKMAVSDVFDETEINDNPILKSLAYDENGDEVLINDMNDRLNTLTVEDVFGDDMYKKNENGEYVDKDDNVLVDQTDTSKYVVANRIVYNLRGTYITDLDEKINTLTVSDVFDETEIESNPILKSLAYDENGDPVLVNDMNERLDTLTVEDVFGDDMYKKNENGEYVDKDGNVIVPQTDTSKYVVSNRIVYNLRGTYITDLDEKINELTVSDVFDETEINSNPILKSLAYDEEGEPVLINDMNERLDTLTIEDVFGDDMYKKNENGEYVDKDNNVLVDQTDKSKYVVANPIIYSLRETYITDLDKKIDTMTVGDIFGDEIYKKKDDGSGDYEQATDNEGNLIFDTDGNPVYVVKRDANHVLAALSEKKISELSTAMDDLYVGDLFVHEIYKEKEGDEDHFETDTSERSGYAVNPNANPILVALRDCRIDEMSDEVANMTVGEIFKNDIYEADGTTVKGSWYYLLKDSRKKIDADGDGEEDDDNPNYGEVHDTYKLTSEMHVMMENMSANMETATLEELNQMGIINLSGNETLLSREEGGQGVIQYNILLTTIDTYYYEDGVTEKKFFCELTVSQLFDYVGKLIEAI